MEGDDLRKKLRSRMEQDESPIDLDEHAALIAAAIERGRAAWLRLRRLRDKSRESREKR